MIKITFEFEFVQEAAKFLTDGSLGSKTNAKFPPPQRAKPQAEEQDVEASDTILPLTPRQRRLRAGKGKQDAPKAKGASKKGAGKGKKKHSAPVSDDISDADLSKAASAGAEKITPNGVTSILVQFGVSHVSELVGKDRREFLDALDEVIEEEK